MFVKARLVYSERTGKEVLRMSRAETIAEFKVRYSNFITDGRPGLVIGGLFETFCRLDSEWVVLAKDLGLSVLESAAALANDHTFSGTIEDKGWMWGVKQLWGLYSLTCEDVPNVLRIGFGLGRDDTVEAMWEDRRFLGFVRN